MDLDELIAICKKCEHHSPHDKMYFMAWWSYCQTKCKLMKEVKS